MKSSYFKQLLTKEKVTFSLSIIFIILMYCSVTPPGNETTGNEKTAPANNTSVSQVSAPVFSPSAGTYSSNQNVSISCPTAGASIYYTIDNSTPGSSSTPYTTSIPVAGNGTSLTIKAIAVKTGMTDSMVASGVFTINYAQVSTPQFSPPAGTYTIDKSISLSTSPVDATIYYTTDGSDPSDPANLARSVYSTAISVSGSGAHTIKAFATKTGMQDSTIATGIFTIHYIPSLVSVTACYVNSPSSTGFKGELIATDEITCTINSDIIMDSAIINIKNLSGTVSYGTTSTMPNLASKVITVILTADALPVPTLLYPYITLCNIDNNCNVYYPDVSGFYYKTGVGITTIPVPGTGGTPGF